MSWQAKVDLIAAHERIAELKQQLSDAHNAREEAEEHNAKLLTALKDCAQVLAVQYQTRMRNGGAGQQAYDKALAIIAEAES